MTLYKRHRRALTFEKLCQAKDELTAFATAKLKSRVKTLLENYRRRKKRGENAVRAQVLKAASVAWSLEGLLERFFRGFLDQSGLKTNYVTHERKEFTARLRALQMLISKDFADLQPDEAKFDQLYRRCKYMENAVQSIHERLEDGIFLNALIEAQNRPKTAQRLGFTMALLRNPSELSTLLRNPSELSNSVSPKSPNSSFDTSFDMKLQDGAPARGKKNSKVTFSRGVSTVT